MSPSDAVAGRIREARRRRGWTSAETAARCTARGYRMSAAVLANIESGRPDLRGVRRRDITIDELFALAAALDVPPVTLMGMPEDRGQSPVSLTATVAIDSPDDLLLWIRGDKPLPGTDSRVYFTTALEQMPTVDSQRVLEELKRSVLQDRAKDLVGQFRDAAAEAKERAREEIRRVIGEAGAALATGASGEELLAVLRAANDRLSQDESHSGSDDSGGSNGTNVGDE
jgi:transcriptional regulator with XRE-family HTH domain